MERGLPGDVHVRPVDGGGVVVYLGASPETLVPSLQPRPDDGRTIIVDSSVTSRAVVRQVLTNLPPAWLAGPVDVRLVGRADGRPVTQADIERISDRLFDGIDGQFALVPTEGAGADEDSSPAAAVERVLGEVAWSARAWKQPVETVVAAGRQIRDKAAADVGRMREEAATGDVAALQKLTYWQVIQGASAGVDSQAHRVRGQYERVAVAAARTVAEMQGEESGEQVSAGAAAQFAAGAGAFGWAGYARTWMEVKQTAHENATAAMDNVKEAAYRAAYQEYQRALSSPPGTGSAEEVARQTFVQYVRDAANALPAIESLAEVVGAAVFADEIWNAVAETETADAAGVLSRAAAVANTTETADAPGTGSGTAETGDPTEGSAGYGVTWLRASGDMIPHLQAKNAAPRGRRVRTLVAHSDGGDVIDGNGWLTPEQVADRLGLPPVSSNPDGTPVFPKDPVTVVMLVCDAARGFVPADLAGDQVPGAPSTMSSPADNLHNVTGQRIVAPRGRAIMLPGSGEVIAGTWHAGDPDSDPVPVESGDWVVWENGEARSLGTPYLSQALKSLDVVLDRPARRLPYRSTSTTG